MVYKKLKGWERQQFRKLPVKAPYWLATNLVVPPFIKSTYTARQGGVTITTGRPTNTAVADGTVSTVRVPHQFIHGVR